MQKFYYLFTALFFTFSLVAQPSGNWTDEGNYSLDWYVQNPIAKTFYISKPEELAGLAIALNHYQNLNFIGITIEFTSDMDFSEHYWDPAAFAGGDHYASGTFNGNGHVLKNVTINVTGTDADTMLNLGLFGNVKNCTLNNIVLEKTQIILDSPSEIHKIYNVGALVGHAENVTISGCSVNEVNLFCKAPYTSQLNVGGIVGSIVDERVDVMTNCYSTGRIKSSHIAGGIAGSFINSVGGTVLNSYSWAQVESTSYKAGGLLGNFDLLNIKNCYYSGVLSSSPCAESLLKAEVGGIGCITSSASASGVVSCYYNRDKLPENSDVNHCEVGVSMTGVEMVHSNFTRLMQDQSDNLTLWYQDASTGLPKFEQGHLVTLQYGSHGSALIKGVAGVPGDTIFIDINPDYGYEVDLDNSAVTGSSLVMRNDSLLYFIMPMCEAHISLFFKEATLYTITCLNPVYGDIVCLKTQAYANDKIDFTATTILSYCIEEVYIIDNENDTLILNNSLGGDKFRFNMPHSDVRIGCLEKSLSWEILAKRPSDDCIVADTIQISTPEQLAWVAQYVSNDSTSLGKGFEGKVIKLMNDIDLYRAHKAYRARVYQWHAIGRKKTTYFKGTFDGQHNSILNLYVNIDMADESVFNKCDSVFTGLFGSLWHATVQNVIVSNAKIRVYSEGDHYSSYIGGISANIYENSLVQDCAVDVDFYTVGGSDAYNFDCGGIVANMRANAPNGASCKASVVQRCYTTGFLHSRKTVGGICGWMSGNSSCHNVIRYCYSSAMVFSETRRSGGIISGLNTGSLVEYCYFSGEVKGFQGVRVGAIAGAATTANLVQHCYYDKQMAPNVYGVGAQILADNNDRFYSQDYSGSTEGRNTNNMISNALENGCGDDGGWSSAIWYFEEGFYPRLESVHLLQACASMVSATPIMLGGDDNILKVKQPLRLMKTDELTWSSCQNKVVLDYSGNDVVQGLLYGGGCDTINLSCGDYTKRITAVYVSRYEIANPEDVKKYGAKVKMKGVPENYNGDLIIWDGGEVTNIDDVTVGDTVIYRFSCSNPMDWHTLTLPFDVQKVTVRDKDDGEEYEIMPRTQADEDANRDGGNFWLKYLDVDNAQGAENFQSRWRMVESTTLEKNKPYIICFKNSADYYTNAIISFYSLAGSTMDGDFDDAPAVRGDCFYYYGNNTLRKQQVNDGGYVLDPDGRYFRLEEETHVLPFHCYVQASEQVKQNTPLLSMNGIDVDKDVNTPSVIAASALDVWSTSLTLNILSLKNQHIEVLSILGQKMIDDNLHSGEVVSYSLPSGVYVVKSNASCSAKIIL